jgi:hypothetical protein
MRIFRLFVSSTFSDFRAERDVLQRSVFPILASHCIERGAEFEHVDLRWGVTESAEREFATMPICLGEIQRCLRAEPRPNFLILLGQRYGWRPLPLTVNADHMSSILGYLVPAERELVRSRYRLDRNAVPAEFRLIIPRRPRSGAPCMDDNDLRRMLGRGARRAGLGERDLLRFYASATHQEIEAALPESGSAARNALAVCRRISGLPAAGLGQDFRDIVDGKHDPESAATLDALIARVRRSVPRSQTHRLTATWAGDGVDTAYLARFARVVLDSLKLQIDSALSSSKPIVRPTNPHIAQATECAATAIHLPDTTRSALRVGRKRSRAVLLLGEGGSGKTTLLSQFAFGADKPRPRCVIRLCGRVAGAEVVSTIAADLVDALQDMGLSDSPVTTTAVDVGTRDQLRQAIRKAISGGPITVLIDGADELNGQQSMELLDWMLPLPRDSVHLIVSARPNVLLERRARRLGMRVVRMDRISKRQSGRLLDHWLAKSRRRLTTSQRSQVIAHSLGNPLWLRLAASVLASLHSDAPAPRLPRSIRGLVRWAIDLLWRRHHHGSALVRDTVALIAASRRGLSEGELRRALGRGIANEVWREFLRSERSPDTWQGDSLPPVLLSRLRSDLGPLLSEVDVPGARVVRFIHRDFTAAVSGLYLQGLQGRRYHRRLADCFRPDCSPTLYRRTDRSSVPRGDSVRSVSEFPHHLHRSRQLDALRKILGNFGFCIAKCAANMSADLSSDFNAIHSRVRDPAVERLRALLDQHRTLLLHGSVDWPAHRILLQVAMELPRGNVTRRVAERWMALGAADWPVILERAVEQDTWKVPCLSTFDRHAGRISRLRFRGRGIVESCSSELVARWDMRNGEPRSIEYVDVDPEVRAMEKLISGDSWVKSVATWRTDGSSVAWVQDRRFCGGVKFVHDPQRGLVAIDKHSNRVRIGMVQPVLIAANRDFACFTTRHNWDTNSGSVREASPIVIYGRRLHRFWVLSRVAYTDACAAMHSSGGLLALATNNVVRCFDLRRIERGPPDLKATSRRPFVSVSESWVDPRSLIAVSQHSTALVSLPKPGSRDMPVVRMGGGGGAAAEFDGRDAVAWADDRGLYEEGHMGNFDWMRLRNGRPWEIDQEISYVAFLSEPKARVSTWRSAWCTLLGDQILYAQRDWVAAVPMRGRDGPWNDLGGEAKGRRRMSLDGRSAGVARCLRAEYSMRPVGKSVFATGFDRVSVWRVDRSPGRQARIVRVTGRTARALRRDGGDRFDEAANGLLFEAGRVVNRVGRPSYLPWPQELELLRVGTPEADDGWRALSVRDGCIAGHPRYMLQVCGLNWLARWYAGGECRFLPHAIDYHGMPWGVFNEGEVLGDGKFRTPCIDHRWFLASDQAGRIRVLELIMPPLSPP